jgi:hypothetical protein
VVNHCDARTQVNQHHWNFTLSTIQFSTGYQVLGLPGRWISEGSLRSFCGCAPLLLPLSTDVQSIFVCKCNLCLEIINTAGWVSPKFYPQMPLNAHDRLIYMRIKNTERFLFSTCRHFPQLSPGGRQWIQCRGNKLWEFTLQSTHLTTRYTH